MRVYALSNCLINPKHQLQTPLLMLFNNLSSLSWQTSVLTFKNRTLNDVKKALELQYGVEILMYHELLKQQTLLSRVDSEMPKDEIKLVLFMEYEPHTDDFVVRGLMR